MKFWAAYALRGWTYWQKMAKLFLVGKHRSDVFVNIFTLAMRRRPKYRDIFEIRKIYFLGIKSETYQIFQTRMERRHGDLLQGWLLRPRAILQNHPRTNQNRVWMRLRWDRFRQHMVTFRVDQIQNLDQLIINHHGKVGLDQSWVEESLEVNLEVIRGQLKKDQCLLIMVY